MKGNANKQWLLRQKYLSNLKKKFEEGPEPGLQSCKFTVTVESQMRA